MKPSPLVLIVQALCNILHILQKTKNRISSLCIARLIFLCQSLSFPRKILKVNENWLLNGGELNTGDSLDLSLPPIKTVPLLSLQQAASWSDYMKNSSITSCVQLVGEIPVNTFAVVLESDSMSTSGGGVSIPNGSTVFVDPDRTVQPGNIVLALPKGTTTPVIRKLEIEGPDILLVPTNPRYPSIMLDDLSCILGVCFKIQQDI